MNYCHCGTKTTAGEICPYCKNIVPDDLEKIEELADFLQGKIPDGISVSEPPNCTDKQAEQIIWYLQSVLFVLPDNIERCDVCGSYYDADDGGDCLDFGDAPYCFCDSCMSGVEYEKKYETRSK
jgi:hypothetical protein